jgi:hypothetical protein
MNYCSSCRRHLNGALVCPGCGAYAPDIAPVGVEGALPVAPDAMTTRGAAAAPEWTAGDTWHDGRVGEQAYEAAAGAGMEGAPPGDPSGDLEGVLAVPQGRAARRRQRARWKKNQRRAVVATAVALVGGGLTLASMDRQSGDRAQAAAAPEGPGVSALEEQTAQDSRPSSPQPDAHRSSPTPSVQSPAPDSPRRQYATDSLRAPASGAQQDAAAAAAPRTPPRTDPQPQTTALSSGTTVADRTGTVNETAAQPTQTPAPAATGGTGGTGDTGSTDSGTSQANTSPTTTSPSQLCLLVVCLG